MYTLEQLISTVIKMYKSLELLKALNKRKTTQIRHSVEGSVVKLKRGSTFFKDSGESMWDVHGEEKLGTPMRGSVPVLAMIRRPRIGDRCSGYSGMFSMLPLDKSRLFLDKRRPFLWGLLWTAPPLLVLRKRLSRDIGEDGRRSQPDCNASISGVRTGMEEYSGLLWRFLWISLGERILTGLATSAGLSESALMPLETRMWAGHGAEYSSPRARRASTLMLTPSLDELWEWVEKAESTLVDTSLHWLNGTPPLRSACWSGEVRHSLSPIAESLLDSRLWTLNSSPSPSLSTSWRFFIACSRERSASLKLLLLQGEKEDDDTWQLIYSMKNSTRIPAAGPHIFSLGRS